MTARLTPEEKEAARHLLYHHGHPDGWKPGGFSSALITCMERADPSNLVRLLQAFPAYRNPLNILQLFGQFALADLIREGQ